MPFRQKDTSNFGFDTVIPASLQHLRYKMLCNIFFFPENPALLVHAGFKLGNA